MEEFDNAIFEEYILLIREKGFQTLKDGNAIVSDSNLNRIYDICVENIAAKCKKLVVLSNNTISPTKEKYEKIYKQLSELTTHIVKCAIIFSLYQNTDSSTMFINYVLKSDFEYLIRTLWNNETLSKEAIKRYCLFLYFRRFNIIDDDAISRIYKSYSWLEDIEFSKGYVTINDKARAVLIDMINGLKEVHATKKEIYDAIDDYFKNEKNDFFFNRQFPDASKNELIDIKKYQFSLIIADAYEILSFWSILDEEGELDEDIKFDKLEADLLELLEDVLLKNINASLIKKRDRHYLYEIFIQHNERDFYRDTIHACLESRDKTMLLKVANPLYQMD